MIAAVVLLALTWAPLPFDRRATTEFANVRLSARQLDAVMPAIAAPLAAAATATPDADPPTGAPPVDPTSLAVLVPSRDVSRVAVQAPSRVTIVGDLYAFLLNAGIGGLQPGQVVVHDGSVDRPVALFKPLEVEGSTPVVTAAGVTLAPLAHEQLGSDPASGIWVVEVK